MIFNKKMIFVLIFFGTYLPCLHANKPLVAPMELEAINRPRINNSNNIKVGAAASLLFSAGIGSFLIAYKKNDKFKKKIDLKKERIKDFFIENVLCPILIKWETIKDEGLTKKDIFYSGLTLIGLGWSISKIYNRLK